MSLSPVPIPIWTHTFRSAAWLSHPVRPQNDHPVFRTLQHFHNIIICFRRSFDDGWSSNSSSFSWSCGCGCCKCCCISYFMLITVKIIILLRQLISFLKRCWGTYTKLSRHRPTRTWRTCHYSPLVALGAYILLGATPVPQNEHSPIVHNITSVFPHVCPVFHWSSIIAKTSTIVSINQWFSTSVERHNILCRKID